MPPYYIVVAVDSSKCQATTCPLSARVENKTGESRAAPAPSTVTLEVLNMDTGRVFDSCQVAISPDIGSLETTTVDCTLSHGYNNIDFTYRFVAVPDNPGYD